MTKHDRIEAEAEAAYGGWDLPVYGDPMMALRKEHAKRDLATVTRLVRHLEELKSYLIPRMSSGKIASGSEDLTRLDILRDIYQLIEVDEVSIMADDLARELGVFEDE